jgi:hypothetical protein
MSAFFDSESLINGLPESRQLLLKRNMEQATRRILERFQNSSYSAGLHVGSS